MPDWPTTATSMTNNNGSGGGPSLGIATWLSWVAARMAQVNNGADATKDLPISTDKSNLTADMSDEDNSDSDEAADIGESEPSTNMSDDDTSDSTALGRPEQSISKAVNDRADDQAVDTDVESCGPISSRSHEDSGDGTVMDETLMKWELATSNENEDDEDSAYRYEATVKPENTTNMTGQDTNTSPNIGLATWLSWASARMANQSNVPPAMYPSPDISNPSIKMDDHDSRDSSTLSEGNMKSESPINKANQDTEFDNVSAQNAPASTPESLWPLYQYLLYKNSVQKAA
ncbi:hypothetical protein Pmani_018692 [Petrolisthes manimaculis]|uniref:Uncharacterized protein n=1 Tax=Petrolisthes manimaculis TaxID=1843537 RepID=A0AAE1U8J1_9EUCA|nr:hypothetical protein Pmani_018692 [Petrolisthes manimaculis]